jgi:hypothetical protein
VLKKYDDGGGRAVRVLSKQTKQSSENDLMSITRHQTIEAQTETRGHDFCWKHHITTHLLLDATTSPQALPSGLLLIVSPLHYHHRFIASFHVSEH